MLISYLKHIQVLERNSCAALVTIMVFVDKSTGPHTPYTYRSCLAVETPCSEAPGCADVNARRDLELCGY